jgi:hypothetical protein
LQQAYTRFEENCAREDVSADIAAFSDGNLFHAPMYGVPAQSSMYSGSSGEPAISDMNDESETIVCTSPTRFTEEVIIDTMLSNLGTSVGSTPTRRLFQVVELRSDGTRLTIGATHFVDFGPGVKRKCSNSLHSNISRYYSFARPFGVLIIFVSAAL